MPADPGGAHLAIAILVLTICAGVPLVAIVYGLAQLRRIGRR